MDTLPTRSSSLEARAGELLEELRSHPEWDEARRADQLDLLVARFPREILVKTVIPRLRDLDCGDGEAILRIVEAMGDSSTLLALADALLEQPGLSSERTWDALGVLEGTGLIEARPDLLERRDELEELLGDDRTLDELAAEIESEPGSTWLALQGLRDIEPDVRAEIIAGLAKEDAGPGVVELLRLLAFAHDPATRSAALVGLSGPIGTSPEGRLAWASLASDHPDPSVQNLASKTLGDEEARFLAAWRNENSGRPRPKMRRSAVRAVDRDGVAVILLLADDRGDRVAAAFSCDVMGGIVDVLGESEGAAIAFFDQILAMPGPGWIEDRHALAIRLLAASSLLCGPGTSPALAYWLERTAGPDFRAATIQAPSFDPEPGRTPLAERAEKSRGILEAMPDWLDASPLTFELAEAIYLRDGDVPPDPRRDPGAFRILFENRLAGRLEIYRRMLLWMSLVWNESGRVDLSRAAEAVARELADPQNAVPGHPFLEALAIRSLVAAQDQRKRGDSSNSRT